MHLRELSVTNFRAFEFGRMEFPPTGLAVLVGPNNAGKSSFLSALDVVAGEELPSQLGHLPNTGTSQVVARFGLTEQERHLVLSSANLPDELLETSILKTLMFAFIESRDMPRHAICAAIALTPPTPDADELLLAAALRETGPDEGEVLRRNLATMQPTPPYHWDAPPVVSSGAVMGSETILRDREMAIFVDLLARWRTSYYHFQALRTGTQRVRPLQAAPTLAPSGENLTDVLLYLNTQGDPAWGALRDLVAEALPGVGRLETPSTGTEVEIAFRDPARDIRQNIKDLGTGVEQLLMTACVGLTQPEASLIVIEEPETNLHPGAQRVLLRYLKEWGIDKQFVVSTHSSTLLNAGAEVPVWTIERSEGVSTISPLSSDVRPALEALGAHLSDVLSASRLLLVEGQSDVDVLSAWFQSLSSSTSTAVLEGGGGDAAWQVRVLTSWLERAEALPRKVLFLRDCDELPPDAVAALQRTGVVHVLHRRELENYLLDAEAIYSVLLERCAAAGKTCVYSDATEVETALRAAADALRAEVIVKRVAAAVRPIRVLSRADVARVIDLSPTLESLCAVVEENLPPTTIMDQIRESWRIEEATVRNLWNDAWLELAPGADLLAQVWRKTGLAYGKAQDGVPLAARISPPEEIRTLVEAFLDDDA